MRTLASAGSSALTQGATRITTAAASMRTTAVGSAAIFNHVPKPRMNAERIVEEMAEARAFAEKVAAAAASKSSRADSADRGRGRGRGHGAPRVRGLDSHSKAVLAAFAANPQMPVL